MHVRADVLDHAPAHTCTHMHAHARTHTYTHKHTRARANILHKHQNNYNTYGCNISHASHSGRQLSTLIELVHVCHICVVMHVQWTCEFGEAKSMIGKAQTNSDSLHNRPGTRSLGCRNPSPLPALSVEWGDGICDIAPFPCRNGYEAARGVSPTASGVFRGVYLTETVARSSDVLKQGGRDSSVNRSNLDCTTTRARVLCVAGRASVRSFPSHMLLPFRATPPPAPRPDVVKSGHLEKRRGVIKKICSSSVGRARSSVGPLPTDVYDRTSYLQPSLDRQLFRFETWGRGPQGGL